MTACVYYGVLRCAVCTFSEQREPSRANQQRLSVALTKFVVFVLLFFWLLGRFANFSASYPFYKEVQSEPCDKTIVVPAGTGFVELYGAGLCTDYEVRVCAGTMSGYVVEGRAGGEEGTFVVDGAAETLQ